MSLKSIIKASLLIAPTFLVLNHDFFTIRKIYKGRVKGNDFCPTFNPKFESSSSFLEDDYVLVRVLGETYEPKDIKQKFVSVLKADGSSEIKLVECIEGEWCPSPFGFTFVQSGHAWVKTFKDVGDTVGKI
jgi:hypothetical protein